jgi:hypothetical protein
VIVSWILCALGDDARAYVALERAVADGSPAIALLTALPTWARLHGQPAFEDIVRRLNLGSPPAPEPARKRPAGAS